MRPLSRVLKAPYRDHAPHVISAPVFPSFDTELLVPDEDEAAEPELLCEEEAPIEEPPEPEPPPEPTAEVDEEEEEGEARQGMQSRSRGGEAAARHARVHGAGG